MACFWQDAIGCYDPACGAPPAQVYIRPTDLNATTQGSAALNTLLFSDVGFTHALTATTAKVTSIAVYAALSGDSCNCDMTCWYECCGSEVPASACSPPAGCTYGSNPVEPPLGSLLSTYPVSITFDPTATPPYSTFYAAAPVVSGAYSGYNTIMVCNVETDVGTALFIFSNECCH